MKHRHLRNLVKLAVAALFATTGIKGYAHKAFPLPIFRESVDKAVADESLRVAASQTADPQVWLGLAYLAQVGSPVRLELLDQVVKSKPEYAPIASVLVVAMDGSDDQRAGQLVLKDPENALGYYLQAELLYQRKKEKEALAAFKKATACPELRLYENITAEALFKALDALHLKGRDRLCAASWTATRLSNFRIIELQPFYRSLKELARNADLETRKEIAEMLLVLSGHLYATDFENRTFAQRAAVDAFQLKAEVAYAEKSPTANGYVTVVQALVSVQLSWPGIEERRQPPLELAPFVAGRIHRAFALVDPSKMNGTNLVEMRSKVPESEKAMFEDAKNEAVKAASALIEAALTDPDEVIGSYLKGLPPPSNNTKGPWVSRGTYVERLMAKRPEVFKAAAANETAMRALSQAGRNDPLERNMHRLMKIGLATLSYASDHEHTCPPNVGVLFEKEKYLNASLEAKSVITGKPYVYVAGGQKVPERYVESGQFILLYDSKPTPEGLYQCVMGDSHGESMPEAELKKQLARQGK